MNNQYPNSGEPVPARGHMNAQRNPGDQPYAVAMDNRPYNGQPDNRYEAAHFMPPPNMPTFGPTNPIGQPIQQNYAGWANQYPQGYQASPNARPLAEQLNPRHQAMQIVINGFTPSRKFFSVLNIFMNVAMTVTIVVFILLFFFVSAQHDTFNTTGIFTRSFILAFGFGLIFLRLLLVPMLACRMPILRNEKIATGFNVLMPYLKFHVFRLNPNFNGRMKLFYSQEWIMALYELVIGIFSVICFNNSYADHGDHKHNDPIPLLLGIFTLIDVFFNFLCFLAIHGKWLKYRCQQERMLAAPYLGDPLLNHQQPQMPPPPPADRNGQYQPFIGEPVYPDNFAHQQQLPVGVPVHQPANRQNPLPQYGAVQYPDL